MSYAQFAAVLAFVAASVLTWYGVALTVAMLLVNRQQSTVSWTLPRIRLVLID